MLDSPDNPTASRLLNKFALDPAPDCVYSLAGLVAGRSGPLWRLTRVIANDKPLAERMMRRRLAASEVQGAVDAFVIEHGIEPAIIVAMIEPLLVSFRNAFEIRLRNVPKRVHPEEIVASDTIGYVLNVGFRGQANGFVAFRGRKRMWKEIAAQMLGIDETAMEGDDLQDGVGELGNTIVGNFKSYLTDAGLACTLAFPSVTAEEFHPPRVAEGRHHLFAFKFKEYPMLLDLVVELAPWKVHERRQTA